MRLRYIILFIFSLSIWGCSDVGIPSVESDLVIEGWIEEGKHPIVMVTTSLPTMTEFQDWETLYDHLVRWAKVTIDDGEETVVLTGKMNRKYFPPYVYTSAHIIGEAGKTYRLTVEYEGMVATASAVIPESVPLEYVKVAEAADGYKIFAGLKDDAESKNYYRLFSMIEGVDSTYAPSFLGLIDDDILADGVNEVAVNGAYVSDFGAAQRSPLSYKEEDVVRFRLSSMTEEIYNYWEDFDDVSGLSSNPFFPVNKKIRSNVSSGMGYWAGYGSSYYRVSIADSLAQGRVLPME